MNFSIDFQKCYAFCYGTFAPQGTSKAEGVLAGFAVMGGVTNFITGLSNIGYACAIKPNDTLTERLNEGENTPQQNASINKRLKRNYIILGTKDLITSAVCMIYAFTNFGLSAGFIDDKCNFLCNYFPE
ncbi:MAG: hypothetical protein H0W88_04765 [Parachlamydiaceae bacterium]|nr:hypothetical protein [Parachlamydiaceae bacterium]